MINILLNSIPRLTSIPAKAGILAVIFAAVFFAISPSFAADCTVCDDSGCKKSSCPEFENIEKPSINIDERLSVPPTADNAFHSDTVFDLDSCRFGSNPREAFLEYLDAANHGDVDAQYKVGCAYERGDGTIEDRREAYIWFSIAKANGHKGTSNNLSYLSIFLDSGDIDFAKRDAHNRMVKIDERKARISKSETDSGITPDIGEIIAAKPPKGANIAEKVFENTWRSIVVIKHDSGQGSGVIIRPNIVATNCHVVDSDGKIVVYKHDNRRATTDTRFPAIIRARNDERDFCLLDVAGLWGIPASIRKYDTLTIGEDVYAVGSPKGLDLSLSSGLISQLRQGGGDRSIQTDAAISPGSSGGGLFDSDGNLIGITTEKVTSENVEGIGFAIPADLILDY